MTTEEFERAVQETMQTQGVDYAQAEVIVAMKYGELHGCLLSIRLLSEEQRRRQSRTLVEVMAELGELEDLPEKPEEPAASARRGDRVAD
jgi:hypothetical protein